jgi:hypothetical protein
MNYSRDPSLDPDLASHRDRLEPHLRMPNASPRARSDAPSPPSDRLSEQIDPPGGAAPTGAATRRAVSRHQSINPWLFVMATALNTMVAAVLAVIITLGVVRQERADSPAREMTLASALSRPALGTASEPTPLGAAQPIELGPIGSPDQPLRLEAQKPARLPLRIQPDEAAREPFILVLSGAPVGTTLSGAARMGSDTWFLSPGSASRLEIALPEWSSAVFEITIALRRTNGAVAAQAKAWIAVPPPASQEAAGSRLDGAAAKDMLSKADRMLEKGDVVAARAVYQRAAEMGSAAAALMLATTYDPNRLWSLGALGMVGNKERAKQWYARASELGSPEAKVRLLALGN